MLIYLHENLVLSFRITSLSKGECCISAYYTKTRGFKTVYQMTFPHHLKINIFSISICSRKFCHFKHFQMSFQKDNPSLLFDYTKGSFYLVYLFRH